MTVWNWMVAIVAVSLFGIAFHPPIPWPIEHHERKVSFPSCPEIPISLSVARLLDDLQCDRDLLFQTCGTPDHPKPEGCEFQMREIPKAGRRGR